MYNILFRTIQGSDFLCIIYFWYVDVKLLITVGFAEFVL